jgi:hypothetical protein
MNHNRRAGLLAALARRSNTMSTVIDISRTPAIQSPMLLIDIDETSWRYAAEVADSVEMGVHRASEIIYGAGRYRVCEALTHRTYIVLIDGKHIGCECLSERGYVDYCEHMVVAWREHMRGAVEHMEHEMRALRLAAERN